MPEDRVTELENKVRELTELVENMQNYHTATPEFRKTIARANIDSDTKTATSENQAVDEAGSNTYNVLRPPDGFDKATISGTTHYYPYYL
jgi:hypothetical protein